MPTSARRANPHSVRDAILRISIVIPITIQILRTPIPHQPCLPVVIPRHKIEIRRRSTHQRRQCTIKSIPACHDATGSDGSPRTVRLAASDEGVVGINKGFYLAHDNAPPAA